MLTQRVSLDARSYDIFIGQSIIHTLGDIVNKLNDKQKSIVIITEENVAALYLEKITHILEQSHYLVHTLILPAGESTKSLTYFEQVTDFCLVHNVERNHAIIALGGGVIGDLTGFVASTLRRGCRFIQIPTTLLAQVDSSVGGKTAINSSHGKNLIGFYQPSAVLIDIDFLSSLSDRVYRSGYAEVIKYGLLGDRPFVDYLADNNYLFLEKNAAFLIKIIAHCVKMKADIVSRDETEQGERALLNLGHTFGHAYEAQTHYSDLLYHGEAVAIGMLHAAEFSHLLGYLSYEDATYIKNVLLQANFNINIKHYIPEFNAQSIIDDMMQDKKVSNNNLTLILYKKIGEAFIDKEINKNILVNYFNNI
ncbi:MAG: 3-dehydroquinate synthase [Dasania sp.]|jgi:3-dehydroquinate synthase